MATHQTPNPYAAAAAPRPPARRRRAWRIVLWTLFALVILVLALLGAAWWWSGTGNSLATALAQATRYLPTGQTLETRDVEGSVRAGGRIGWLRWSSPTLTVEVQDARIGWSLPPLLQRELALGEVHAARVIATPRKPAEPQPDEPLQPLEQLVLPLRIDVPLRVDEITWAADNPVTVRNLAGRYRFDGERHRATLDSLELAQGRYTASATLQALAPMALELTADGTVRTPSPGGGADLEATAHAEVRGTLATAAARLDVMGRLQAVAASAAAAAPQPGASAPAPAASAAARRNNGAPRATASNAPASAPSAAKATPAAEPMQADVQARIAPWAPQPLLQAQAEVRSLDVAALWPQAPKTRLSGRLAANPVPVTAPAAAPQPSLPASTASAASSPSAAPSAPPAAQPATGWALSAQLDNALPGPWDRGRLPVESIDARADFDGARWTVPQATARVGGGTIVLEGAFTPATKARQGDLELRGVRPDAVMGTLDATPLAGRVRARSDGSAATAAATGAAATEPPPLVRFSADIRAAGSAGRASAPRTPKAGVPLRIDRLAAEGTWQGTVLTLAQLQLDALQAQASARQLRIDTAAQSAQGQLQASVPGATVQADGRIAPRAGAGSLDVRVADAQRVQRWIESVPGLRTALGGAALQGEARLGARWNGGWQSLQGQLQAAGLLARPAGAAATAPGPFDLNAQFTTPRWEVALPPRPGTGAGPATVRLTAVRADIAGSVANATLSLDGEARMDERRLDLRLRGSAGAPAAGQWRAQIDALRLQARDGQRPGPWTVQFTQPLTVTARTAPTLLVETTGGQARVSGPAPGEATLRWEPVRFARTEAGGMQLRTRGQLQGLPMAWAEAFAQGSDALDRIGLQGNLVFDGDWDVDAGDTLRASAGLRRTAGDIRLLTGSAPATTVVRSSGPSAGSSSGTSMGRTQAANATATDTREGPGTPAGVRAAELRLQTEGETVRARLQWDSERAGQVQAEASTRLGREGGGWQWPADAPVAATVRARLPDVGVWSTLAPPGWRVQGTLDADVALSGTRTAPRWSGTLAADQLAVRSLLDGVDLQNGRLRAALRGDRLDITEFRVSGGQGSSARIAGFSGNRTSAPKDGGTLSGTGSVSWAGLGQGDAAAGGSGIAMDFNAEARALQVLVRADRQVSVSGQVRAQLRQGQLSLRGKLTADRATIILPEAGAPSLGSDVVVRSAAKDRATAEAAQREGARAGRVEAARPPDIALTLNLGDDFALQGHGITTRLTGELEIRGATVAGGPPRVTGEVRTVEGRYRAWGQSLNVETGLARFNGPYDNPALDVLAIRPNISVRAGVQVTGSAKAPRVALYSDPELPDAEKLSWVVLGRSAAAGGAEAALLQQAALALLGGGGGNSGAGNFANRLGLDEIGFRGPNAGSTGEDASGAALTFGKRLSKDLYVTYERSLSGALGTLYIFYDLTQRLTLRGQTGVQSAVDLIYTLRYD
ncbi:translocation/assembly module TamB domain-containing protein [Acidovorax sp. GBBC 3334]|uniref:translocation/assembly module TamB domain-containing protein n=1 Tax=Acidovorax sp. GBBC 3334 TaxID=2940496 RepID=UPI00230495ED|nr:translocation/assembly module TamB domain-containing protein [Acidovorax sp. GBBC 3334]MDA8453702.1 translocation/assembly module TamB domain-containing protein [Acidovorax sp. GBBC 3334]